MNKSGNGIKPANWIFLGLSVFITILITQLTDFRSSKIAEKVTTSLEDKLDKYIVPNLENRVVNKVENGISKLVEAEIKPLTEDISSLITDVEVNSQVAEETQTAGLHVVIKEAGKRGNTGLSILNVTKMGCLQRL